MGKTVRSLPPPFLESRQSDDGTAAFERKFSLNKPCPAAIYCLVRRLRNILFALAALLWLPVSAHCQLEALAGMEFLSCELESAGAHNSAADCEETNCCAVEKSHYRAILLRFSVPPPVLFPADLPLFPSVVNPLPAPPALPLLLTAAPPEFEPTRHFLDHTALPVRPPSFSK
jgi:hypothetical protein